MADKQPDSLAKIIDTIEGAVLPMAKSMLPGPLTYKQMLLINQEIVAISKRLWNLYWFIRSGTNDDDADISDT